MKRKIAALVASVMVITSFTGCSADELAYLQMGSQMIEGMEVMESTASIDVEVDVDAMKKFAVELGYEEEMMEEFLPEMNEVSGTKTFGLDLDMLMDLGDTSYTMGLNVSYDDKTYDLGDIFYGPTEGVYLSGETVLGAMEIFADVTGIEETSYLTNPEFLKELEANLNKTGYIALLSMDEMGLTTEELATMNGNMESMDTEELYTIILKLYTDAFSDFSTGMVTKSGNGYELKADGKKISELVLNLIDYVGANYGEVTTAVQEYTLAVMKISGSGEEELAMLEESFAAMTEVDAEEVKMLTDAIKSSAQEVLTMPEMIKVMDSFDYTGSIQKEGNAYVSKELITIMNGTEQVAKMTTTGKTLSSTKKVVVPTAITSVDDFATSMEVLENKYNPVNSVSLNWWSDDTEMMAAYTEERAENSIFGGNFSYVEYLVEDGRMYAPLRVVTESLGEVVEWNNAEKTSYVTVDGEKIPMTGMIAEGTTFVQIRDFEKLGYEVVYENLGDMEKLATVTKTAN